MKKIHVVARSTDPETSHQAAFDFSQKKAARSVSTVIRLLQEKGPLTDFEIITAWPEYWEGLFSYSLPPKARLWAREQGYVKHVGYGKHNGRRVRLWGLGKDEIEPPVVCPTCKRKTRAKNVIANIESNESPITGNPTDAIPAGVDELPGSAASGVDPAYLCAGVWVPSP